CELIGSQAAIAWSCKLLSQSGITASKSTSNFVPSPSHVGQAPKGLLNENRRGSSSSIEKPHSGQAWFSLMTISSSPITSIITRPFPKGKTVTIESDKRLSTPSLTTILSTITSIEWVLFLSKLISSVTSYISPLTRTRTKPSFCNCSNTCTCSPLRPETTGANT